MEEDQSNATFVYRNCKKKKEMEAIPVSLKLLISLKS